MSLFKKTIPYLRPIAVRLNRISPKLAFYFNKWRHSTTKRLIHKDVDIKLTNPSDLRLDKIPSDAPIYVMWWQGEEKMPEIVKCCFLSLQKVAGNHPIILITKDNWQNIIDKENSDLPWRKDITSMIEDGRLTLTTFSDVIRSHLLYTKGGIWVDSTIFFTGKKIDELINDQPFFTRKLPYDKFDNHYVGRNKWAVYIMGSVPGNKVFKNIHSGILAIIEKYGKIYEYFTIDYIMETTYEKDSVFRQIIDNLPVFPQNTFSNNLNDEFNEKTWNESFLAYPFHKLSWKDKYRKETQSGKKTFYKAILEHFDKG